MVVFFTICYYIQKSILAGRVKRGESISQRRSDNPAIRAVDGDFGAVSNQPGFSTEYGKELTDDTADGNEWKQQGRPCDKEKK